MPSPQAVASSDSELDDFSELGRIVEQELGRLSRLGIKYFYQSRLRELQKLLAEGCFSRTDGSHIQVTSQEYEGCIQDVKNEGTFWEIPVWGCRLSDFKRSVAALLRSVAQKTALDSRYRFLFPQGLFDVLRSFDESSWPPSKKFYSKHLLVRRISVLAADVSTSTWHKASILREQCGHLFRDLMAILWIPAHVALPLPDVAFKNLESALAAYYKAAKQQDILPSDEVFKSLLSAIKEREHEKPPMSFSAYVRSLAEILRSTIILARSPHFLEPDSMCSRYILKSRPCTWSDLQSLLERFRNNYPDRIRSDNLLPRITKEDWSFPNREAEEMGDTILDIITDPAFTRSEDPHRRVQDRRELSRAVAELRRLREENRQHTSSVPRAHVAVSRRLLLEQP